MCVLQVRDGGECNLSEVTASDVGGLNTDAGRKSLVHHFEMKPILGKYCVRLWLKNCDSLLNILERHIAITHTAVFCVTPAGTELHHHRHRRHQFV